MIKDRILGNHSKELNKFQTYILYFFLFAFIGWCLETAYCIIVLGHFTKRGFLFGPICPIYGYGALILIIFLEKYKSRKIKLFTYSAIIFSVLEYIASYILETIFHAFWWDYRTDAFNLNGRIAAFYSLAWGFIAIIFIDYLYPFLNKNFDRLLSKVPYSFSEILIYLFIGIYFIDTAISCLNYSIR